MRWSPLRVVAVVCAAALAGAVPPAIAHPLDLVPEDDAAYRDLYRLGSAGLAPLWAASVRPRTRVDVARAVSHALARVFTDRALFSAAQLRTLEHLVLEFADELALLGYRVVEPPQGPSALAVTGWGTRLTRALSWRVESGVPPWFELDAGRGSDLVVDTAMGFGPALAASARVVQPLLPGLGGIRLDRFSVSFGGRLAVQAGREPHWWGPGARGAFLLSSVPGPMDRIVVEREADRLRIVKVVAPLSAAENRHVYGTRVDWLATDALRIGVGEAVVASGGVYLPYALTPFPLLAYGLSVWTRQPKGITDNYNASIDFDWRVGRGTVLYGELYVDELSPPGDPLPSRGGATAGLFVSDLFRLNQTDLRLEHARATNWIYTTGSGTNRYLRDGETVGHWCAPDCELWSAELSHHIGPGSLVRLGFDLVRKGEGQLGQTWTDPAEAWAKLYLSGVVETTQAWRLRYEWMPNPGFHHELGVLWSTVTNASHMTGQTRRDWFVWWEARVEF
jgi:capsule assembly protein Wzi